MTVTEKNRSFNIRDQRTKNGSMSVNPTNNPICKKSFYISFKSSFLIPNYCKFSYTVENKKISLIKIHNFEPLNAQGHGKAKNILQRSFKLIHNKSLFILLKSEGQSFATTMGQKKNLRIDFITLKEGINFTLKISINKN